jgi:hypothetical protein
MSNVIATYAPNGELIYLPSDFVASLNPQYFVNGGLGVLPILAAPAAIKAITAGIQILPKLLTNQFWKDAGPAVTDLNAQAKAQLAESQALLQASNQQNVSLNQFIQKPQAEANIKNNTMLYVAGGIGLATLIVGGVVINQRSRSKSKSKPKK